MPATPRRAPIRAGCDDERMTDGSEAPRCNVRSRRAPMSPAIAAAADGRRNTDTSWPPWPNEGGGGRDGQAVDPGESKAKAHAPKYRVISAEFLERAPATRGEGGVARGSHDEGDKRRRRVLRR